MIRDGNLRILDKHCLNIPDEQHFLEGFLGKLIIVKSKVADLGIEVDVLYVDGERGSHPVAGGRPCRALAGHLTNRVQ